MLPWLLALAFLPQTNPEAYSALKSCSEHVQQNQAEEAIKACRTAVSLDGQSGAGHLLLGQAYLATRSIGRIADAKAELQQALDLDPTLIWGHFYLAKVYLDTGRADKAKSELEQALQTRPGVPHFLSLLGEAERRLGHSETALEWHRKALAADPKMNTVHYYAALAYMDLKNDAGAIAELEAAIQSPYQAPDIYLTLGSLYTKLKRYREAEDVCRKASSLDPARAEPYLRLAQVFNAQGLSDKALGMLRRALPPGTAFPSSPYYQELQADIQFEFGRAWSAKGNTREATLAYERCLAFDANRTDAQRALASSKSRN